MQARYYYKSTLPWTPLCLNHVALNKRREQAGAIAEREIDDSRSRFTGWTWIVSFPARLTSLEEADLCVEYYQHP